MNRSMSTASDHRSLAPGMHAAPHFPVQLHEFEHALMHEDDGHGFGGLDSNASVCCLEHGAPWQPGRWRYHHDYELHLITEAYGCAYVGDEVHGFAPGSVVLIGPRLPHNFVFMKGQDEGVRARSLVLRFTDEPLRKGMELFPELREAEALLDRARRGVEFLGLGEHVAERFQKIRNHRGLACFSEFAALLHDLAQWTGYRMLTTPPVRGSEGGLGDPMEGGRAMRIYKALDHIKDNYAEPLTLADVSAVARMPESAFSRYFRRATGNTFTDFVIGLRVAKACRLLLHTRKHISSICYEVGFNNISNFNRHFRKLRGMPPGKYRACGGLRAEERRAAASNPSGMTQ